MVKSKNKESNDQYFTKPEIVAQYIYPHIDPELLFLRIIELFLKYFKELRVYYTGLRHVGHSKLIECYEREYLKR
jgi:hypothetical protein